MKANDVKIGGEYEARIAGETMQVRILAEKASGGWTAQNMATKKKVFVPLARQLREPGTTVTTATTEGNLTVVEVPPATVETIWKQHIRCRQNQQVRGHHKEKAVRLFRRTASFEEKSG
jgi:hypothetical protein